MKHDSGRNEPARMTRREMLGCTGGLVAALLSGCGYTVGNEFPTNVGSVWVPTFTNTTFRRNFELYLTEAVQKQIMQRTPYRLAKGGDADSQLTGKILGVRKGVLGENQLDDPRELQLSMAIEVRWDDLRTGRVLAERNIPLGQNGIQAIQQAAFAPEVGHSLATATQQVVDQLARDVVNMMEVPV